MFFPHGDIRLKRLQSARPFKTALAAACALESRNICHGVAYYTALRRADWDFTKALLPDSVLTQFLYKQSSQGLAMTTETPNETQPTPSMSFANEIINLANAGMQQGKSPDELAQGIRHAAANFSAYAFFLSAQSPKDPNDTVEDFVKFFEYYLSAHAPKPDPGQGLAGTIAQAKDEL